MAAFDPTTSDQVWYPFPDYPGYWINSDLEIMGRMGRLIRVFADERGYRRVVLRRDGKYRKAYLHHAIAALAYGPRPPGLNVLHWDDDKANNFPSNLRYGTYVENMADSFRNGKFRTLQGADRPNSKLDDDDIRRVRTLVASGLNQSAVGRIVGVSPSIINEIVHGKRWTHVV